MAKLTRAKINQIIAQARESGLDEDEILALYEALLARVANLTGEQRLALAISELDEDTQLDFSAFAESYGQISKGMLKRGKQELDNIADSQWEQLVKDANPKD